MRPIHLFLAFTLVVLFAGCATTGIAQPNLQQDLACGTDFAAAGLNLAAIASGGQFSGLVGALEVIESTGHEPLIAKLIADCGPVFQRLGVDLKSLFTAIRTTKAPPK